MALRDDKEAMRKYKREWMAARRKAFFVGKSCVQCGATEHLELDHIDPSTKVTHAIWSWSAERQSIELAKCQVLCKACHKVKTVAYLHTLHGYARHDGSTRSNYRKGCRCDGCRYAQKMYARKLRAKITGGESPTRPPN